MKDQKIYNQLVLEIVEDEKNDFLSAEDTRRFASLAEKYYRQGYEDATKAWIEENTHLFAKSCVENTEDENEAEECEDEPRKILKQEVDRLANFLLEKYSDQVGVGNTIVGESAVDVAIRLLSK